MFLNRRKKILVICTIYLATGIFCLSAAPSSFAAPPSNFKGKNYRVMPFAKPTPKKIDPDTGRITDEFKQSGPNADKKKGKLGGVVRPAGIGGIPGGGEGSGPGGGVLNPGGVVIPNPVISPTITPLSTHSPAISNNYIGMQSEILSSLFRNTPDNAGLARELTNSIMSNSAPKAGSRTTSPYLGSRMGSPRMNSNHDIQEFLNRKSNKTEAAGSVSRLFQSELAGSFLKEDAKQQDPAIKASESLEEAGPETRKAQGKAMARSEGIHTRVTKHSGNPEKSGLLSEELKGLENQIPESFKHVEPKKEIKPKAKNDRDPKIKNWLLPILKELVNRNDIKEAHDTVDTVKIRPDLGKFILNRLFGDTGLPLRKVQNAQRHRPNNFAAIAKTEIVPGPISSRTGFLDYVRPINDNVIKNGLSPPCLTTIHSFFSAANPRFCGSALRRLFLRRYLSTRTLESDRFLFHHIPHFKPVFRTGFLLFYTHNHTIFLNNLTFREGVIRHV